MEEDIKKFKAYLAVLNEENILYRKQDAIDGLLSLYIDNAQKELREELERQINAREINAKYIEDNFISKSKVKEKIEELEPLVNKYDEQMANDEDTDLSYNEVREYACKIEAWRELLED